MNEMRKKLESFIKEFRSELSIMAKEDEQKFTMFALMELISPNLGRTRKIKENIDKGIQPSEEEMLKIALDTVYSACIKVEMDKIMKKKEDKGTKASETNLSNVTNFNDKLN